MQDTLCWSVCVTQPEKQLQCLVAQRLATQLQRDEVRLASKQTSSSLFPLVDGFNSAATKTQGNFLKLIISSLSVFHWCYNYGYYYYCYWMSQQHLFSMLFPILNFMHVMQSDEAWPNMLFSPAMYQVSPTYIQCMRTNTRTHARTPHIMWVNRPGAEGLMFVQVDGKATLQTIKLLRRRSSRVFCLL